MRTSLKHAYDTLCLFCSITALSSRTSQNIRNEFFNGEDTKDAEARVLSSLHFTNY
jgi:hypothetical protein